MIAVVMYQVGAADKFDLSYYLQTHMPLVRKLWGPIGLRRTQVLQGTGAASGGPAPYHIIAVLDFDSMDAFQSAAATHGKEIMGDVPNFTSVTPVIQFNEVVG